MPVVLGNNGAAQAHAEDMLANCFSSHWNLQGLTPAVRYAFAGGTNEADEIVSGRDYCITAHDGYRRIDPEEKSREVVDNFWTSLPHWEKVIDPLQHYVNIGLAWDDYNFQVALQFATDGYIKYEVLQLEEGVLALAGTLQNGAVIFGQGDMNIALYYRPPPTTLTVGQLARIGGGLTRPEKVASIVRPPPPGTSYRTTDATYTRTAVYRQMPHEIDPNTPRPRSAGEASDLHREARALPGVERTNTVYRVTADVWDVDTGAGTFRVVADIAKPLTAYGDGIYLLYVWVLVGGVPELVSGYAFLVGEGSKLRHYPMATVTPTPTAMPTDAPAPKRTATATPTAVPVYIAAWNRLDNVRLA